MKRFVFLLSLTVLAGCAEPMVTDGDVIRRAADPAFDYDARGQVQATSCRSDRPSGYSSLPSGCQRDVVFARQVANPADLVDPRAPGPAAASTVGRAADRYLSGNSGNVPAVPTTTGSGTGTVVYPPPPTDPYYR